MGTLDTILTEAGTQFGLSNSKASSLLSSLLSLINETPGGLAAFLDRFRKVGLGDSVSSWLGNAPPRPIADTALELALGHDRLDKIAARAGLSYSTVSSALGFMIPNVVQRLSPGGIVPTRLPADVLAYAGSATSAVAAGARETAYAASSAVRKTGVSAWLWSILGLLALLALFLIGYRIFGSHLTSMDTAFNVDEQVRLATQKASAALAALPSGFTANDLISALNLNVINFASNSAQLPADSTDYLNRVAAAIKAAPTGTGLEISGHTDNTGDSASNMTLSQQRAEAVRGYLIQQGVSPSMLIAKGYGDTRPVASNATEEGKFRNRRIEFSVQ
jgi:outer membrane protein OmpA-like peptidoglycan-associated protein/uncharacterized protein YidB (DUF937 family)